jgi:tripartite-type tricarboxylate transporter receptor subunit TctC
MAGGPNVLLVHPSGPAKTVPEFRAYAKANPGKPSIGSAGVGNSGHPAGELFKAMTNVDMTHVPYRGGACNQGGQVQVLFNAVAAVIEHIRAGRIRPLAVTSTKRAEVLSEIPTVNESGPGYVTERLDRKINGLLASPNIKLRLIDMGAAAMPGSSSVLGTFVARETEKWARVIRAGIIRPG